MFVISLLVYNQPDVTRNCIESLLLHTKGPYLLLLVDNASRSDTAEYLRAVAEQRANVRYVRNDENLGFIKAHNAVFRQYESDFFCVMNNDVIVRQRAWDEMFIGRFAGDPDLAIAGPKQLGGRLNDEGIGSPRISENCDYIEGWCLVVRTALIKAHLRDLFDETYMRFAFCEDSDLSLRVRQKGFNIAECADIDIVHLHNVTFRAEKVDGRPYETHNRNILTKRWKHYLKRRDFTVPFKVLVKLRGADSDLLRLAGIVDELRYQYPGCDVTVDTSSNRSLSLHILSWVIGEYRTDLRGFDEVVYPDRHVPARDPEGAGESVACTVDSFHARRENAYAFVCKSCGHQLNGEPLMMDTIPASALVYVRGYCSACQKIKDR